MKFSMTLSVSTHYSVEVEADSLEEACAKAEELDPEFLDVGEVEKTTSDHDWVED